MVCNLGISWSYSVFAIFDLDKTELNNSSQDIEYVNWLSPAISSERIAHRESNIIESSSGRRLESAEVLKQKYINNDIQDLPRYVRDFFAILGRGPRAVNLFWKFVILHRSIKTTN